MAISSYLPMPRVVHHRVALGHIRRPVRIVYLAYLEKINATANGE